MVNHSYFLLIELVIHKTLNFHLFVTFKGETAQEASEKVLKAMQERIGKSAGAITIGKDRSVGIAFTSRRMAWAYKKDDKIHYGIEQGQELVDDIKST